MGPIGPQGPIGPKGNTGLPGQKGVSGKVGPTGPMGNLGQKGSVGEKGQKGEMFHINWKQCVWESINDDKDFGLIKVKPVYLFFTLEESIRIIFCRRIVLSKRFIKKRRWK